MLSSLFIVYFDPFIFTIKNYKSHNVFVVNFFQSFTSAFFSDVFISYLKIALKNMKLDLTVGMIG
jgi:hypothetical protein